MDEEALTAVRFRASRPSGGLSKAIVCIRWCGNQGIIPDDLKTVELPHGQFRCMRAASRHRRWRAIWVPSCPNESKPSRNNHLAVTGVAYDRATCGSKLLSDSSLRAMIGTLGCRRGALISCGPRCLPSRRLRLMADRKECTICRGSRAPTSVIPYREEMVNEC